MEGHDVGSEIQGLIRSLERDNPDLSATGRVEKAWNKSVDDRIRSHVNAVFVVPDTAASEVIIYVDDPLWATELNMKVELLRLNLNNALREIAGGDRRDEQVETLKIYVSKKKYESKNRRQTVFEQLEEEEKTYRQVQPVELSDDEISGIQEAAAMMKNEKLRDIAYSAAKANLEWQKGLEKRGA